MTMRRRVFLRTAAVGAATVPMWHGRARAQAKPVRIGYTLSATGPYAVGAGITQAPNYSLWQEQVNARGRARGQGRGPAADRVRRPSTTAARSRPRCASTRSWSATTRSISMLPPWGTADELRRGADGEQARLSDDRPDRRSRPSSRSWRFPYFYAILVQPERDDGLRRLSSRTSRRQGKLNKVAVAYVNDLFGIELNTAPPAPLLKEARLRGRRDQELSARREGPLAGAQGLQGRGRRRPSSGSPIRPTTSWSRPRPRRWTSIPPSSSPRWARRFRSTATASRAREGVMGIAGWNPKVKFPGAREYYDAHVKKHQKEPDRWASAFAYASLQILERCVGEVGLDRAEDQGHARRHRVPRPWPAPSSSPRA